MPRPKPVVKKSVATSVQRPQKVMQKTLGTKRTRENMEKGREREVLADVGNEADSESTSGKFSFSFWNVFF